MDIENDVKKYWKNKSSYLESMITDDERYGNFRDKLEKRHLFRKVKFSKEMIVLDLGCGTGRWSFPFAEKSKEVIAVDISPGFINTARGIKENKSVDNILFFCQSIMDFSYLSNRKFDIIHLGGVLQYLNDESVKKLLGKLCEVIKKDGILITRDSINFNETKIYKKDDYVAIVRLKSEFLQMFTKQEFVLTYCNDSFLPTFFPDLLLKAPNFIITACLFILEKLDFIFLETKILSFMFSRKRGDVNVFHIFERSQ